MNKKKLKKSRFNATIKSLKKVSTHFVTAIVPAYNEEKTIKDVISVLKLSIVDEIIVVDDGSLDKTSQVAKLLGVKVIKHKRNFGKGMAMKTGVKNAKGNILVFLDADLKSLTPKKVNSLIRPLKSDEADFVKSYYSRYNSKTGTSIFLYRPLLRKLFHGVDFVHPVSGQISGKKSFFDEIVFRNDYGIDISILLDAVFRGLRIKEICLGKLSHRKKSARQIEHISNQVIDAIIEKAHIYRKF
ncbi:MAG: glycosyltransferase family 2 protein [Candidatus Woesearchaeota archaeon]